MKKLIAVVALFCMTGSLLACPLIHVKKVVAAPVVVTPVVTAVVTPVYVPIPVLVPTYSATYAPSPFGIGAVPSYGGGFAPQGMGGYGGTVAPGPGAFPTPPGSNVAPPQQQPGIAPPAGQAVDARNGQSSVSLQKLFATRCAACHQGDATAAASGGGQVLMEDDGSLSRFSPAEYSMIQAYVLATTGNGHSCPPRNPLPKEEQDFLVRETSRLKAELLAAARQATQRKDTPVQPDRK